MVFKDYCFPTQTSKSFCVSERQWRKRLKNVRRGGFTKHPPRRAACANFRYVAHRNGVFVQQGDAIAVTRFQYSGICTYCLGDKKNPYLCSVEMLSPVELSIVIGVYNEAEVLDELERRLTAALRAIGRTYEIILVDDGSRDESLAIMFR